MFRSRDGQSSLFRRSNLMPAAKQQRVAKTWAAPFRERALPLTDEEVFARLMADDLGRLAFEATTARILETLGTGVSRQRLDSSPVAPQHRPALTRGFVRENHA